MKIIAAIIGTGIGEKHFEAIEKYKGSKVKIICEKNTDKFKYLKKKYPDKFITNNENLIFKDSEINLVSIASYDQYHFPQIIKSIKNNKHIIAEKPMCLTINQLKKIKKELNKNPKIKFTSNLVLRYNTLFNKVKKKIDLKNIYHIDASYLWGRKEKLFNWRSNTKDYSLTLGATIHILDLICWILNSKPSHVFAKSNKKITKNTKFKKFSFASYVFTFPNDVNRRIKISSRATGTTIFSVLAAEIICSNCPPHSTQYKSSCA